ncbi:unnamed protein product [Echinostoma caproni]|uniref:ANK_REP_REGION domain-containing protein n=1 Tax=Echinostoma caproni TaxID=27848 RepID=A0A183AUX5_9TREM|nr:unnamed protein product [Echinostoma caproni]
MEAKRHGFRQTVPIRVVSYRIHRVQGSQRNLLQSATTPECALPLSQRMMTPLHWAADRGLEDIVSVLLIHSADLNAQDEQDQTPLHYACSCGHISLARLLYKAGANISITDQDGQNPIDLLEEDQRESVLA